MNDLKINIKKIIKLKGIPLVLITTIATSLICSEEVKAKVESKSITYEASINEETNNNYFVKVENGINISLDDIIITDEYCSANSSNEMLKRQLSEQMLNLNLTEDELEIIERLNVRKLVE